MSIASHFVDNPEALDWLLDQGVDITRTDIHKTDTGSRLPHNGKGRGSFDYSLKILNKIAERGDIQLFDHIVSRGADPLRSLALHRASKCEDTERSIAMIDHLLDRHHMDIEADTQVLRPMTHYPGDSGTPLVCAVWYKNIAAVQHLLKRGADPESAIQLAIGRASAHHGWLPAVGPLLKAGADVDWALESAVNRKNLDAAKLCVAYGADPSVMHEKLQLRASRKAAGLEIVASDEEDIGEYHSSADDEEESQKRTRVKKFLRAATESRRNASQ
jgi:hypothetical protein